MMNPTLSGLNRADCHSVLAKLPSLYSQFVFNLPLFAIYAKHSDRIGASYWDTMIHRSINQSHLPLQSAVFGRDDDERHSTVISASGLSIPVCFVGGGHASMTLSKAKQPILQQLQQC